MLASRNPKAVRSINPKAVRQDGKSLLFFGKGSSLEDSRSVLAVRRCDRFCSHIDELQELYEAGGGTVVFFIFRQDRDKNISTSDVRHGSLVSGMDHCVTDLCVIYVARRVVVGSCRPLATFLQEQF